MSSKGKQGSSFLFCLCDMRRAVIMMDILSMIGGILLIIAIIFIEKYAVNNEENGGGGDSDDLKEALESANYDFWPWIITQSVGVFCHLCGVLGAVSFSICPILLPLLWQITYAVLSGIGHNWIGLAIAIVWIYPHVFLCYELAKGIMTRDNYEEQERQSCCCV